MSSRNIRIPLQGPPYSSASKFFAKDTQHSKETGEKSDLLKSIHIALRGSDVDLVSSVQSTVYKTTEEPHSEEELTWNAHTVILAVGGVIFKKWNFEEEGQSVQWACCGWLEQTHAATLATSQSASHSSFTSHTPPAPSTRSSQRPTFGPFNRAHQSHKPNKQHSSRYPAVFVFLRSIGKVFLRNGLDYTFSIPFIVRKAWPLFPHGVMIQRVLDPTEMEESEVTGDAVLPTIFSVTSPFSEAGAVGLTTGIVGGSNDGSASLRDEEENSTKPLKSIPPTEAIVWVSNRRNQTTDDVLVTVDTEKHQLSIWRYVYVRPKDIPVPLGRARARNMARKRQSLSSVLPSNRRHSAMFRDGTGHGEGLPPLSPHVQSRERSPTPEFPELPPLSALPGMPPSLSTTTTMSSLVTGKPSLPQWSTPRKMRRNSLTRNDLSVTMDRMVLGGRIDTDANLAPIEHGRMKAAYWMERLYSQDISEAK
jgi:anaphase-promoting complex subunit 1